MPTRGTSAARRLLQRSCQPASQQGPLAVAASRARAFHRINLTVALRPIADVCPRVREMARDQADGALCSANVPRVGLRPPLLLDFAAQSAPPSRSEVLGLLGGLGATLLEAEATGCPPQRNQGGALGAAQGGGHSRRRAPGGLGRRGPGNCGKERRQRPPQAAADYFAIKRDSTSAGAGRHCTGAPRSGPTPGSRDRRASAGGPGASRPPGA